MNQMRGEMRNFVRNMFSGSFRIFRDTIMNPYFRGIQNENEKYYINPPMKTIIWKLIFMWVGVWLSFMLTFNGREIIMCFFWIPLGTGVIYFIHTWKKFGYSPLMYCLMNIAVISTGYGFSRIVHFVIGVIING